MFRYVLKKFFKCKQAFFLVVITLASRIASVVAPYINGVFIDFLAGKKSEKEIIYFALITMSINLFSVFLLFIVNIISIKVINITIYDLLEDLIYKLERSKSEEIEGFSSAYLSERIIGDTNIVTAFALKNYISVFFNCIAIAFSFYIFIKVRIDLIIILLCLIPPYIIVYWILRKPFFNASSARKEAGSVFLGEVSNRIHQVENTKLRNDYSRMASNTKRSFFYLLSKTVSHEKLGYLFSSADGIVTSIFQAIMIVIGGIGVVRSTMTIGEFAMLNMYFSILVRALRYYLDYGKEFQNAKASYNRIEQINNLQEEEFGEECLNSIDSISLKSVEYRYNRKASSTKETLKYDDIVFNKNNGIYIITGENGSGKTTLIKIIVGLLNPVKGSILFNQLPIEKVNLVYHREKSFSVSMQVFPHNKETIENYLEITSESENKIKQMSIPFSDLVLQKKKHRFDTLSSGEQRKIELWLCLSKDAEIYILDEPTTGLDSYSKEILMEYLFSLRNKIIIISTHDDYCKQYSNEVISLE